MDLGGLSKYLESLPREIRKELVQAEEKAVQHYLQVAFEASSGPYNRTSRRRDGTSYSKANPNPPDDPEIINVESDTFRQDWDYDEPAVHGDVIETTLYNDTWYGRFFNTEDPDAYPEGTDLMIARPILRRIERLAEPVRQKYHEEALDRILS